MIEKQNILRLVKRRLFMVVVGVSICFLLFPASVPAFESLGVGTAALLGNDLTDLGDDGDPEADDGYDAIFDANHEPGFGSINQDPNSAGAGESAFNVFDNILGPGNDKWCCGIPGGISEDEPLWVSAQLPVAHFLTNFTVSSANDVPERDPIHWAVQGSNDGQNYTDIYVFQDDFGPWFERLEVIEFREGEDFPVQTTSYEYFRLATFDTINNQAGAAAYFQIGEIEYFGRSDGEIPPIFVGGEGTIGVRTFEGDQSNEMFGPEQMGVPGWSARIVTIDDHGLTLDNHTLAEEALDDNAGVTAIGAYSAVDMAGGGGTFTEDLPYPNGVAGTSQSDFAVRVEADVTIPAGSWTIGFGSDDGGQVTIAGVEFSDFQNNDSFDDDQIRFEGNRGHGWTVGTFELTEELQTTIVGSFHERGGGDSFEIAVLNDAVVEDANPDTGWELLSDGTFGWSVTTTTRPLVSADLSADVQANREWQFDVDGDSDAADQFVVANPDPNIFTTILNIDGVTIQVNGTGALADGDAFVIIDADRIEGTAMITSVDPAQSWVFDATTGRVCLTSCPGVSGGDYNGDGMVNVADVDLQSAAMKDANPDLATFDENQDGLVNIEDRKIWINTHANTYAGDSNFDGEFGSGDLVAVFTAGKFENGEMAGWAEGDWNGDMLFGSGDLVFAFQEGGFELGPRPAAAAVPEPSGFALALLSLVALARLARRRNA